MKLVEELKDRLIESLDLSQNITDEQLREIIASMVMEQYRGRPFPLREKIRISRELFHSIRGLDILQEILEVDGITEIMVNGYDRIFIEQGGKLSRYPGQFASPAKLSDVIQSIAARANKRVNEASPILDTRLEDGSRVNIVLAPVCVGGPVVTIRRFPEKAITMDTLIAMGSITTEAAQFLRLLVINGYNLFISGGTGSGKTTMLNALSDYIPGTERIITIEDSAELRISHISNLVSLECRQANTEGENAVTIRDLIRTSLRMRPDRIVVGEVRGGEALDMLQAMNTGHDGSLSTGHGNSPADMLSRLEVMTLMAGEEIPMAAVRSQIASALDILVHLGRMKDGSRKVLNISQIEGIRDGTIRISTLFEYKRIDEDPGAQPRLVRTGVPLKIMKGNMEEQYETFF
ncbi:MAG: CpaF family protein [Parasporobacterium sp.]|nr:CpaF family protein [Parasporobacterium sp.]